MELVDELASGRVKWQAEFYLIIPDSVGKKNGRFTVKV